MNDNIIAIVRRFLEKDICDAGTMAESKILLFVSNLAAPLLGKYNMTLKEARALFLPYALRLPCRVCLSEDSCLTSVSEHHW